jgi:hypothetical protein
MPHLSSGHGLLSIESVSGDRGRLGIPPHLRPLGKSLVAPQPADKPYVLRSSPRLPDRPSPPLQVLLSWFGIVTSRYTPL